MTQEALSRSVGHALFDSEKAQKGITHYIQDGKVTPIELFPELHPATVNPSGTAEAKKGLEDSVKAVRGRKRQP